MITVAYNRADLFQQAQLSPTYRHSPFLSLPLKALVILLALPPLTTPFTDPAPKALPHPHRVDLLRLAERTICLQGYGTVIADWSSLNGGLVAERVAALPVDQLVETEYVVCHSYWEGCCVG